MDEGDVLPSPSLASPACISSNEILNPPTLTNAQAHAHGPVEGTPDSVVEHDVVLDDIAAGAAVHEGINANAGIDAVVVVMREAHNFELEGEAKEAGPRHADGQVPVSSMQSPSSRAAIDESCKLTRTDPQQQQPPSAPTPEPPAAVTPDDAWAMIAGLWASLSSYRLPKCRISR